MPSLLVLILLTVLIGPVVGLLAASAVILIAGILLMITAGLFYDRIEFSG